MLVNNKFVNCNKTPDNIIPPPIKVKSEGNSLANKYVQTGPRMDSESMITPTIAEGVLRAPMVINIKPKPTWKKPAVKPSIISCDEIISFSDNKNPITQELTPAIN